MTAVWKSASTMILNSKFLCEISVVICQWTSKCFAKLNVAMDLQSSSKSFVCKNILTLFLIQILPSNRYLAFSFLKGVQRPESFAVVSFCFYEFRTVSYFWSCGKQVIDFTQSMLVFGLPLKVEIQINTLNTVKSLLSLRGAYLILDTPEGGLLERGAY